MTLKRQRQVAKRNFNRRDGSVKKRMDRISKEIKAERGVKFVFAVLSRFKV